MRVFEVVCDENKIYHWTISTAHVYLEYVRGTQKGEHVS